MSDANQYPFSPLTAIPGSKKPVINLRELEEVDTIHLPKQVIRFAQWGELVREANIVKAEHKNLEEEVDLRLGEEEQRRRRRGVPPMQLITA